jgi:hypothetical protein
MGYPLHSSETVNSIEQRASVTQSSLLGSSRSERFEGCLPRSSELVSGELRHTHQGTARGDHHLLGGFRTLWNSSSCSSSRTGHACSPAAQYGYSWPRPPKTSERTRPDLLHPLHKSDPRPGRRPGGTFPPPTLNTEHGTRNRQNLHRNGAPAITGPPRPILPTSRQTTNSRTREKRKQALDHNLS